MFLTTIYLFFLLKLKCNRVRENKNDLGKVGVLCFFFLFLQTAEGEGWERGGVPSVFVCSDV